MTTATEYERGYLVVHVTEYDYSDDVSTSYGRAHMLPRALQGQVVVSSAIQLDPDADELRSHVDFFGNVSTYFAVRRNHRALRVTATSEVRVDRSARSISELDRLTWEEARDALADEPDTHPMVLPSPLVRLSPAVHEYAEISFTPRRPLGSALHDLRHRIYKDFDYVSGSTNVSTTLADLLKRREGVCQDFAHLAVGCLRSVGLPARYVSGYLETSPPRGQPKLQGSDASHAWASLLVPGMDWVDFDPTNDQTVDARYIVAGWGRDYSDVPPLKGVILTHAKTSTMTVSVDVTRTS